MFIVEHKNYLLDCIDGNQLRLTINNGDNSDMTIDIAKIYEKYIKINEGFSEDISQDTSRKITIHKPFEIKISPKGNICDFASSFTFENCIFEKECRFEYITFGNKELAQKKRLTINFKNCKFQSKVYFTNCVFNGEVCFNNSTFKDYADFHESIFNDTASFYNTTFESAPNFSTCVFKDIRATNFINVNIKRIDMNSIEKFIEERKNDKDYANDRDLDYKIRYANNARDSFRTIKDVLIANNNLLDASQWHKLELYAKENELEFLMEETEKEYKKEYPIKVYPWLNLKTFIKKNALNLSYWADSILLQIYRTTSEHHTNFIAILNFTATMIVIYAILLLVYVELLYLVNDSRIEINNFIVLIATTLLIFFVRISHKDTIIIAIFTRIYSFYTFMILQFILLYVYFTDIKICYTLFYFNIYITIIIFIYYIYLFKEMTIWNTIYRMLILISYIGLLCVLLLKPMLLNPFIGIFNTDSLIEKRLEQELQNTPNHILVSLAKDITGQNYIKYCYDCNSAETINIAKNIIRENQNKLLKQNDENHLQNINYRGIRNAVRYDSTMNGISKTTSIIYSIILLLCIFSLQKTARKNSIIPS